MHLDAGILALVANLKLVGDQKDEQTAGGSQFWLNSGRVRDIKLPEGIIELPM
jgi:hypothetical protein